MIHALGWHRGSLIRMASDQVMCIQKVGDQMNLPAHHILKEITN